MIPYILQVAIILTVCFLFYKLFLQKATFYGLNRWTLLCCLVLSFVVPLVPAPRGWTLNIANPSVVMAKPIATSAAPEEKPTAPEDRLGDPNQFNAAAMPHDIVAKPGDAAIPAAVSNKPTASVPSLSAAPLRSYSFFSLFIRGLKLLSYAYLLGLLVFGFKFALQILVLCYRSLSRSVIRDGHFRIVETNGNRGPCTFANTIFINPALYDPATYQQILVHEKIHVSGRHTWDILLAELAVVFQWFNPFAWLYRREVENNLEFLTDRSVLEHPEIERSAYQLSLLRVSAPYLPFSITNNYNHSLLKRRIVMMNSQHSGRHTTWKYVILVPIFILLICVLNKPAAFGQSAQAAAGGQPAKVTILQATAVFPGPAKATAALADTTIRPAKAAASMATTATTTTEIHPAIAAANETVSTSIAASVSAATMTIASADTSFPHFTDNMDLRQGSWFLTVDSDNLEFMLRAREGENSWQSSFTIRKSEINPYPGQGTVEFKLVREAGAMSFKGSFDGEQGYGHFQFQPDESYFSEMQKLGVEDMDEGRKQSFFLMNITKDFVRMLNRNGYTPIEQHEVFTLAIRKVDEPFLKYWKNAGVEGTNQIHNLFMLKSLHIDPDYVEELKKAGYTHLTVEQLIRLKRQNIDGNYIRAMNSGAATPMSPEELVQYKFLRIDSGYLTSLRKVGYDHLDRSEIHSLFNAHVTADYIKGFQDGGFSNIPPRTLVMLKYQNVTPELAKSFRDHGYSDVDLNRLGFLQRAGITADFINGFHKIGYDNIPLNVLYSLKSAGVDADYVTKMKEKGFNSTDLNKYIRLRRDFN